MKYSLLFLEEAKQEWLDAVEYYESKQKRLGTRFSKSVEAHLQILIKSPKYFKKVKKDYRQILVKPFPFLIIYRIDETKYIAVIVSVFHAKRHPKEKYNKE